jgi:hypothetical protein
MDGTFEDVGRPHVAKGLRFVVKSVSPKGSGPSRIDRERDGIGCWHWLSTSGAIEPPRGNAQGIRMICPLPLSHRKALES